MKVLIVKTSSMGDIIHALPLVHDLTAAHPDAEIHWLAEESFRDIPTFAPAVSSVHRTAFRRWRRTPFAASVREEIGALKSALREADYDAVLDIQGLLRSAVAARWTGKPVTGYTRRTVREPLASWFYDKTLDLPESLGAVRRYRLAAAEAFGYAIDEEHPVFALRADRAVPLPVSGPYAALAVNTSRDEKLWPEAHWVRLSEELLRRGMRSVIFWGNPEERLRAERIAARIEGRSVRGRFRARTHAACRCGCGACGRTTHGRRRYGACASCSRARPTERGHFRFDPDRDPASHRRRAVPVARRRR